MQDDNGKLTTIETYDFGKQGPSYTGSYLVSKELIPGKIYLWGVTANDNSGGALTKMSGDFTVAKPVTPKLNIISLQCFDNVIVGEKQSCSVKVVDNDNAIVGGADVKIFFSDNSNFGQCQTDSLSGGCNSQLVMNKEGTYTVYATASESGYEPDSDKNPTYNFNVLNKRYDIIDLAVYNGESFSTQDYDFFRGENMFVQFKVKDLTNEQFVKDIVTKATLVSLSRETFIGMLLSQSL